MDVRQVLGGIGLFADVLPPQQLDALAAKCHFLDYREGTVVMTEGEFGNFMIAVVWGRLAVTVAGGRRAHREVAFLGPGDVVGEMSLMTGQRRAATVTVVEPARAVEITKVALEGVFTRAPELLDRLGEVLARRRAELDRISADENAHRVLGVRTEEIVQAMRRLFGRGG